MAGLFLATAAYVFVRRQEVWLTVPEALRGADVYADGSFVTRVEDPSLTYFSFWRQRRVLEVRHTAYRVVRISLSQGRSYPAVSEAALIAVASILPASPATPASPHHHRQQGHPIEPSPLALPNPGVQRTRFARR